LIDGNETLDFDWFGRRALVYDSDRLGNLDLDLDLGLGLGLGLGRLARLLAWIA